MSDPTRADTDFDAGSRDVAESRWLPHALLITVASFVVIAVAWAAFAEIDQVARGEGKVIARSQNQVVQNLEGGIISEILVREGDVVEKGQVLVRIDDTRFSSSYREGEQGALSLKARIARLTAESSGRPLAMPADVVKGDREIAAHEQALFDTRRRELAAKSDVLRQQLAQRESELAELRTREERLRESYDLVRREVAITAPMVKQGVMSELELLRQEREASRIRTDLDAATQGIPRARAAVDESKRRLEDGELTFRSQAGAELSQLRSEYARLAETLPALQDRLSRTVVKAPSRGVVKTIVNKTPGGVVQAGSPIVELVPTDDSLIVEARVSPADIAFIHPGQRAVVKLTAYDFSVYGGLEGVIDYVSADTVEPREGPPYYLVHVRASSSLGGTGASTRPVLPGMTANVDVITGKHTILHFLLKPVNRALGNALRER